MIDSPDVEVRRQIEERLEADSRTKNAVIDVGVFAGQATLSGEVHGAATKAAAEEIARSVPGVHVVNNELRVR